MTDTVFTNGVTLTDADWFNDVNRLHYTIFGDPTAAINAYDSLKTRGANVASAATLNLSSTTGDYVHITGTTTITAVTLSDGDERTVIFDGILTLTHGASLVLPGAANITTAANDFAIFRGDAAGVVRCVAYSRATVAPLAGDPVLKSTFTTKGDLLVTTAASTVTRLAVGTDGQALVVDSAQSSGIKWAQPTAGFYQLQFIFGGTF